MQPAASDLASFIRAAYRQSVTFYLITYQEFADAVEALDSTTLDFARTRWVVAERNLVVNDVPTNSKETPSLPHPVEKFNPWDVNPISLPDETRQVVVCPTCVGDKKIPCPECQGGKRLPCRECRQTGQVPAQRGGMKKCPGCKGKTTVACGCRTGSITCSRCEGSGKVERWLKVEEKIAEHTLTQEPGKYKKSFPWPSFPDVNKRLDTLPFEVALLWEGQDELSAPETAQTWLTQEALRPTLDAYSMRIQKIELQVAQMSTTSLQYQLAGVSGMLYLRDKGMVLDQKLSDFKPLFLRLVYICGAGIAGFLASSFAYSSYVSPHNFYHSTMNAQLLGFLHWPMTLGAMALALFLASPKKWTIRTYLPRVSVALAVCLILQLVLNVTGKPSAAHARQLAAQDKTDLAFTELDAALQLNPQNTEAQALHDELRLKPILASASLTTALQVGLNLYLPNNQATYRAHLQKLAENELANLESKNSVEAIDQTLAQVPEAVFGSSPTLQRIAHQTYQTLSKPCLQNLDFTCLQQNYQKLKQYKASEKALLDYQTQVHGRFVNAVKAVWTPAMQAKEYTVQEKACQQVNKSFEQINKTQEFLASLPVKQASYTDTCTKWKIAEQDRQKRLADELARQKARAAALQQQQEEAAAQRIAEQEELANLRSMYPNGRLQCADGSLSPTCDCTEGRGCCSHHGGVVGCKRY